MSAQAKRNASDSIEPRKNTWRPKSLMERIAELERQRAEAERKRDEKAG
jgi:hypothetical protein